MPLLVIDGAAIVITFILQHLAAGLVPGLSVIDRLWQLWDKPYQQCLHDKFADTVVVKLPATTN